MVSQAESLLPLSVLISNYRNMLQENPSLFSLSNHMVSQGVSLLSRSFLLSSWLTLNMTGWCPHISDNDIKVAKSLIIFPNLPLHLVNINFLEQLAGWSRKDTFGEVEEVTSLPIFGEKTNLAKKKIAKMRIACFALRMWHFWPIR